VKESLGTAIIASMSALAGVCKISAGGGVGGRALAAARRPKTVAKVKATILEVVMVD